MEFAPRVGRTGSHGARQLVARLAASLAVATGYAALGTWWSALLLGRAGGLTTGIGPTPHDVTHVARSLHADAGLAAMVAAGMAAAALAVARRRRPIVRRLALGTVSVSGLVLLSTWAGPAVVDAAAHGALRHLAKDLLGAGAPVRPVVVGGLVGGLALAAVTLVPIGRHGLTTRRAREAAVVASARLALDHGGTGSASGWRGRRGRPAALRRGAGGWRPRSPRGG